MRTATASLCFTPCPCLRCKTLQETAKRAAPKVGLARDVARHSCPLVLQRGVRVVQRAQHGQELRVGRAALRQRAQPRQLRPGPRMSTLFGPWWVGSGGWAVVGGQWWVGSGGWAVVGDSTVA